MDFFIQNIIPYILIYKYITIFVITFFAAFILPIPSGSMLMVASLFASEGYLSISLIIIVSIIGNIIGDNMCYILSFFYGKKTLSHIGFRKILESKNFKTIEQKFKDHPGFIIFASRFEVLSTLSVNILSGLGKVSYRKYLFHEIFGTIAQVLVYAFIGYFFGYNWSAINSIIGRSLISILFILVLIFMIYRKKIFPSKS